jgi:hypothetical protein
LVCLGNARAEAKFSRKDNLRRRAYLAVGGVCVVGFGGCSPVFVDVPRPSKKNMTPIKIRIIAIAVVQPVLLLMRRRLIVLLRGPLSFGITMATLHACRNNNFTKL